MIKNVKFQTAFQTFVIRSEPSYKFVLTVGHQNKASVCALDNAVENAHLHVSFESYLFLAVYLTRRSICEVFEQFVTLVKIKLMILSSLFIS